jgi:hypothetical protein
MKHIVSIHIILIAFSAFCAYILFYQNSPENIAYMKINKKTVTENEFQRAFSQKPYYQSEKEFLGQFIETELLVQKAIKENLHKDEKFKSKIKSFYEKNLVQLLMEKKISEFNRQEVSEKLLKRYLSVSDKKIEISEKENDKKEEKEFNYLNSDEKYELINTDKDNFCKDNICYKVLNDKSGNKNQIDKESALKEIKALRGYYLWNNWINELKENAKIAMIKEDKKG